MVPERKKRTTDSFERSIYEECIAYKRDRDIQLICIGDLNSSPESEFIQKLSGSVEPTLFNATRPEDRKMATWKTPEHKDSHIDYVFYGMGSMLAPVIDVYHNEIIDTPISEKSRIMPLLEASYE